MPVILLLYSESHFRMSLPKLPIYLDYNATTPVDPRVLEVMLPYFTQVFGNPASRTHSFGWVAEEGVKIAREQVAQLIGAEPEEIISTSGATEACNLAIKGTYEAYASAGNHIITCATEHKAVLDSCQHLEKQGAQVTYLPVNQDGQIDPELLERSITEQTILIAIMYANNETGVLQPVTEIGAIAKKHGVLFFSDATQAVGKIPVNVQKDDIDLMAFSAHKFYGPKGVGGLYVRRRNPRVRLIAQQDGGGHERGRRSGTLNVPGIAGLGKACAIAAEEMVTDSKRMQELRDQLEHALMKIEGVSVNGKNAPRLPNVSNLTFSGVESEGLLLRLAKDIALSSGSACTSATLLPSYVLQAMGLDDQAAYHSLRISLGRFTTPEEVNYAVERIRESVVTLRQMGQIVSDSIQ